MRLADLGNTAFAAHLSIQLARWLPMGAARTVADAAARLAARNPESPLVQAVRSNQSVVRGLPYGSPETRAAVDQVLQNAMRAHADVFRALAIGRHALMEGMVLDDSLKELLDDALPRRRGVIMVGAHMSAFEFMLLTLTERGYPGLALAYANPTGSYRVQNEIRRRHGLDVLPIDMHALRTAIERLRGGGLVMTGVDRPDPAGRPLRLCGRLAQLPVGHARLAMRAGSLLVAVVCASDGPNHYRGIGLGQLDPHDFASGADGIHALAQAALDLFEPQLRSRPGEWLMFYPLWPEAIPA
ncbi:MAG: lysophospholipid acyltransferase family protein [Anaerolineales bacterium]|nr:lysophospholipid acyltransferase family protein [Anaerolineales bacterium]